MRYSELSQLEQAARTKSLHVYPGYFDGPIPDGRIYLVVNRNNKYILKANKHEYLAYQAYKHKRSLFERKMAEISAAKEMRARHVPVGQEYAEEQEDERRARYHRPRTALVDNSEVPTNTSYEHPIDDATLAKYNL